MSNYERRHGVIKNHNNDDLKHHSEQSSPVRKPNTIYYWLFFFIGVFIVGLGIYFVIINPDDISKGATSRALYSVDEDFRRYLNCINDSMDLRIKYTQDPYKLVNYRSFKEYKEVAIDKRYLLRMEENSIESLQDYHDFTQMLLDTMNAMANKFSLTIPSCKYEK